MATLIIRKKGVKTWWHYPSDEKEYSVSKMYCKITGDLFSVVEQGGRQRGKYDYSDITVYDDTQGGSAETFASANALMLRLEQLDYIGFPLGSGSGGVGFQPTIVNPENGQVIVNIDGIWQNGYLDTNGNRFLSLGDILVNDNEITLTVGFSGVINASTYANTSNWVEEINYASSGMQRKDKILFLAGGNFVRLEGDESISNPVEPITPINTLEVTVIDVFDDSIGQPTPPITGTQYIKKPNNWININNAGGNQELYSLTETYRVFNITGYSGSGKVTGFGFIIGGQTYAVQDVKIKNSSGVDIPLEHNSGDLVIPFWFENEEDYILKSGELLTLVLTNGRLEVDSSSLGSDLELGETSTTAYRGDRGKTAYDHSQVTGNPHSTSLQQVVDVDGTVTDKVIELDSATPNSSKVTINHEEVKVENVTDGKSTKLGVQEVVFTQGMNKLTIQPEAIDDDYDVTIQAKNHTLAGLHDIEEAGFIQRTGTAIAFDKWATYGTYASPVSGDLSYSFVEMVKGMIQVMYHEDSVAPALTDVGVTVIETGDYVVDNVNKITVHCIDENVVEVNIKAL